MPTYRSDLDRIARYVPGRGSQEILHQYGLERVIKLASNESPYPPFPEVIAAVQAAAPHVNRYPETDLRDLGAAVGAQLGVAPESIWFGGGGAGLLLSTALAAGGPGTSAVYSHPSFIMYRIATAVSGARAIEVALDAHHRHDLEGMAAAVAPDTTIIYVCNPNNPSGTHVPTAAVRAFVAALPSTVLVVVDEAYFEFVGAPDYESMAAEAAGSSNVVVLRTFSKVYGLAGLRIGYLVGRPDVLGSLRRTQVPFSVTDLAQVAAVEALRHPTQLRRRVEMNAAGRMQLVEGFTERGVPVADSQTNFLFLDPGVDPDALTEAMLRRGVIIRPTGTPRVRITVGLEPENDECLRAFDGARRDLS